MQWIKQYIVYASLIYIIAYSTVASAINNDIAEHFLLDDQMAAVEKEFSRQPLQPSREDGITINYWLDMQQYIDPPKDQKASKSRQENNPVVTAEEAEKEPEMAILHVTLNAADIGEHFISIASDNRVLISPDVLQAMGVPQILYPSAASDEPLSLNDMAPTLRYHLNIDAGELALTVAPDVLAGQTLDLNTRQPSTAEWIQDTSAFVNYNLNYNQSAGGQAVFQSPFELAMNTHGVFASSNFTYGQGQPVRRTQSQMVYDNPALMQRWMLGDIQASSGRGGGALGGLQVSSNFGMQLDLLTVPGMELQAMLATPSEVEVYINGNMISKESLPAGPLTITNPPTYGSNGDVELVIRDAFGREQRYNYDFYGAGGLLAPGLHSYNYSVGISRQQLTNANITYRGNPVVMATHRIGINNWLTSSFGAELRGDDAGLNMQAIWAAGFLGQFNVSMAGSRRAGLNGLLSSLQYIFPNNRFISSSLSAQWQTLSFGNVLADPNQRNTEHWNGRINLGLPLGGLGSLSARYQYHRNFDQSNERQVSALLSGRLPFGIGLSTQATRVWKADQTVADTWNFNMNYSFKNGSFLSANFALTDGVKSMNIQLQKSLPFGEGVGYRASLNSIDKSKPLSSQELQYQNSYGKAALTRSDSSASPSYAGKINSAFLWAGGGLHMTRPVNNGYAIIRVNQMPGIGVRFNNQDVGVTDASGELVVPNLNAYADNHIDLNIESLPLGYNIDSSTKTVTTSFRSGGVVEFNIVKMQVLEGMAFYRIKGEKISAQYSGFELVKQGEEPVQAIIGYGGVLYMENIQPGQYDARIFNETKNCHFKLSVPEVDDFIVDLGDVVCDLDADPPDLQSTKQFNQKEVK
ncbi:MAG: fimbrial biogenesis outer membrane usher protein [Mariprofundus sp.]|nr:fimbrial biogenesis outer membrane usher protein [Mariprofundus sp.]